MSHYETFWFQQRDNAMKHITFEYDSGQFETLVTKTAQGSTVEIAFHYGDVSHITLGDHEILASDDVINSIFLSFEKSKLDCGIISLSNLIRHAENEVEDFRTRHQLAEAEEASYRSYVSSPYQTGRV